MAKYTGDDNTDKLSVRKSIGIWIIGAVFSWVVVVVSLYNVLRFEDSTGAQPTIAQDEAERLNKIMPAAGTQDDQSKKNGQDDPSADEPPAR